MTAETEQVWTGSADLATVLRPVGELRNHPDNPWQGRETSVAEDAYLAGIIDGEGCVNVYRWRGAGYGRLGGDVSVYVANTSAVLLDWLVERYGGRRGVNRGQDARHPEWKTVYFWRFHAANAERILRIALPYLIVKREQAELALAFRATVKNVGRRGHPPEVIAERQRIYDALKALNRRGRHAS